MEKITLADGTELENAHALKMNGSLSFYIQDDMSLADAYALMGNPAKTETITAFRFGTETEYVGYTNLVMIQKRNDQVSGILTKGDE